MTQTPPMLRNSALTAPFAVAAAWFLGSPEHAAAAAISATLVLGNLWVLSILGPKIVGGFAKPEADPWMVLWVGGVAAKFFLLVGGFLLLVRHFPPMGVAAGFVPMLAGALLTALELARAEDLSSAVGEG